MSPVLVLTTAIIAIALTFAFINGFHNAANSVSTVVSTRVLSPGQAVLWAAFFNFVAAFGFGTGVAQTVGKGLVDLRVVTPLVILGGLLGAIVWDLLTWYWGLPTSSSHALMGGYSGAAIAHTAHLKGVRHMFDAVLWAGWTKTIVSIFVAPLLGGILAWGLMIAVHWMFRRSSPRTMDVYFRKLQLVSAAFFR